MGLSKLWASHTLIENVHPKAWLLAPQQAARSAQSRNQNMTRILQENITKLNSTATSLKGFEGPALIET